MIYFISDQHFGTYFDGTDGALREAVFQGFCTFLRDCSRKKRGVKLYILGDFFDFWIEKNGRFRRDYRMLLSSLKGLVTAGVSVTYLRGNHDFMNMDFLHSMGIGVQKETCINCDGKKIYLAHGHELRRSMRKKIVYAIVRSPVLQKLYTIFLPFSAAVYLAESVAFVSRKKGVRCACDDKYAVYQSLVFEKMVGQACDAGVLGHLHRADLIQKEAGVYANCGTWLTLPFTVLELQNGRLALQELNTHGEPCRVIKSAKL
jgi:UDP-2,3-diacylglucosamine pyrophosphatase LpxH